MQRPCARKEPAVPQALKDQGSLNASVRGEVEAMLPGLDHVGPCSADPDLGLSGSEGAGSPGEGF